METLGHFDGKATHEIYKSQELGLERLPLVHTDETHYGGYADPPKAKEDIVQHFILSVGHDRELQYFNLMKEIDGLHYVFSLGQTIYGHYGFSFKTDEYEFATTNLSDEGFEKLTNTIARFIETVDTEGGVEISEIHSSPAGAAYSSREIEDCMDAILKSSQNAHTREELIRRYKGFQIFDFYRELFDRDFQEDHYSNRDKMRARSRFFKMFQRYLPGWEVENAPGSYDLVIKRKEGK